MRREMKSRPPGLVLVLGAALAHGFFLLHSFEYEWARSEFQTAVKADPACAMAHCGTALTYNRTIWSPPTAADLALAWAAVQRAGKAVHATEKDRRFITAAVLLFEDHQQIPKSSRDRSFSRAMARLHDAFPDDVEIGAFYALSVLGLTLGRMTSDLTREDQAAAILRPYLSRHPGHLGVVHYLIHSLDATPGKARQGLPAARRYALIVPGIPHAQHMPAHIYFRLGMWKEGLRATLAADRASVDLLARMGWPAEKRDFHNAGWKLHAFIQLGRLAEAETFLEEIGSIARTTRDSRALSTYITMRYRYLLDGRRWEDAFHARPVAPSAWEAITLAHTVGIAAGFSGHPEAGVRALAELKARANGPAFPDAGPVLEALEVDAALAMARGEVSRMIGFMERAVPLEEMRGTRGYHAPAADSGSGALRRDAPAGGRREARRNGVRGRPDPEAQPAKRSPRPGPLCRAAGAPGRGSHASRRVPAALARRRSGASPPARRPGTGAAAPVSRGRILNLAALGLLLTLPGPVRAENWPAWRGPRGTGISEETGLPVRWGPHENIACSVPLPGKGVSSPIVWGDRIFVTTQEGATPVRSARNGRDLTGGGHASSPSWFSASAGPTATCSGSTG
ncbi:MAG: hypothetical protein ACE5HD_06280 [Acidobacteriota bacterium]